MFRFSSEKEHLKIPRDIQDAKMLAKVLDRYKDMYYFEVMFGVVVAYVLYPFPKQNLTNLINYHMNTHTYGHTYIHRLCV